MRTTVLLIPWLASTVKEMWIAEVKQKSLTSAEFEPTTSGVDHQCKSSVAL